MELNPLAPSAPPPRDWTALATTLLAWGRELGFEDVGITDTDLSAEEPNGAPFFVIIEGAVRVALSARPR